MRILTVIAAVCVTLGCSSSVPTAPSLDTDAAATASTASLAGKVSAQRLSACAAYGSQYRGLCEAAEALQCASAQGGHAEQCDRLRAYISRDVVVCSTILWLCPDGFVSFADDSGCGCRVAPPSD